MIKFCIVVVISAFLCLCFTSFLLGYIFHSKLLYVFSVSKSFYWAKDWLFLFKIFQILSFYVKLCICYRYLKINSEKQTLKCFCSKFYLKSLNNSCIRGSNIGKMFYNHPIFTGSPDVSKYCRNLKEFLSSLIVNSRTIIPHNRVTLL